MTAGDEATVPYTTIELRFLGRFAIRAGDRWHSAPSPKKGGWLLQYLGSYPDRVASRDELAAAFWPLCHSEDVAHRIHIAASGARAFLRRLFGIDALECIGSGYSWHSNVRIVSDADTLLEHANSQSPDRFRLAAELYRGEYLAGETTEWLQRRRIKFAAVRAYVLQRLVEYLIADGDYVSALSFGLDLIDSERGHEAATRLVMRCFAQIGQPLRAMEQFRLLESHLADHLGVEPAQETASLRDELVFGGAKAS
jgi:DNA-binding SARP family transcriptional activator